MKRTLDVKTEHEGKVGIGVGKEAMRSLYFELGKRQADSHALSLSLAECNQSLTTYKKQLDELKVELGQSRSEANQKRMDVDILSQQSIMDKDEISDLREKLSALFDSHNQQKQQIQHLVNSLEEERKSTEICQNSTIEIVSSLSEELEKERREKDALLITIGSQRSTMGEPCTSQLAENGANYATESLKMKNSNLEKLVRVISILSPSRLSTH